MIKEAGTPERATQAAAADDVNLADSVITIVDPEIKNAQERAATCEAICDVIRDHFNSEAVSVKGLDWHDSMAGGCADRIRIHASVKEDAHLFGIQLPWKIDCCFLAIELDAYSSGPGGFQPGMLWVRSKSEEALAHVPTIFQAVKEELRARNLTRFAPQEKCHSELMR